MLLLLLDEEDEEEEEDEDEDEEEEDDEEDEDEDDEQDDEDEDEDEDDDGDEDDEDSDNDEDENESEDDDDYYDEDEDPGEKPSTAKTEFDAATLWQLKQLKQKMKVNREQERPKILEEELPETPKVEKAKASQNGEIKLAFNQDMLFEEIFGGLLFTSETGDAETKSSGRRLA